MKKASVIIPVHNTGPYLRDCLTSVVNQSLKDIEIIIVNDGSTDNSADIIEEFRFTDNRIIVITQNKQGVSAARNNGLERAAGEYIYFLDSDDIIASNFIEEHYYTAKKNNSDIVITDRRVIEPLTYDELPAFATFGGFLKAEFLKQHPDIRFPIGLQPCEDGIFSHMLLTVTKNISRSFNTWYYYRQHNSQNSHKVYEDLNKFGKDIPMCLTILKEFYDNHNLWETHSLHFARFIQHEPFYCRFYYISKNHIFIRRKLYKIIKTFYDENLRERLTEQEVNSFGYHFKRLINSNNFYLYELKDAILSNTCLHNLYMKMRVKK